MGVFFLGLLCFASSCVFVSHAKQHATNRPSLPGWEISEKDAGLPDQNRRDPHKPGESPALQLPQLEKLFEIEERIGKGFAPFETLDKAPETLHLVRQYDFPGGIQVNFRECAWIGGPA